MKTISVTYVNVDNYWCVIKVSWRVRRRPVYIALHPWYKDEFPPADFDQP